MWMLMFGAFIHAWSCLGVRDLEVCHWGHRCFAMVTLKLKVYFSLDVNACHMRAGECIVFHTSILYLIACMNTSPWHMHTTTFCPFTVSALFLSRSFIFLNLRPAHCTQTVVLVCNMLPKFQPTSLALTRTYSMHFPPRPADIFIFKNIWLKQTSWWGSSTTEAF